MTDKKFGKIKYQILDEVGSVTKEMFETTLDCPVKPLDISGIDFREFLHLLNEKEEKNDE
jgi:hypothetical protein